MTQHLRLRIHVTEPWDFERANGTNELTGWTVDHADEENEEWEVTLDQSFEFREKQYRTILVGPRYVGEHLRRMFDAVAGFPVRIAHRQNGDRSEEHTSELQSLMRISYAVFCLKKKKKTQAKNTHLARKYMNYRSTNI